MVNRNLKIGQRVMFTNAVVRQCGHDKTVADMRGIILEVKEHWARVDTQGTYPNEEGSPIRYIPIKNLALCPKRYGEA